jgi:hypothetical protein
MVAVEVKTHAARPFSSGSFILPVPTPGPLLNLHGGSGGFSGEPRRGDGHP